nr:uncharacterized protein LOC122270735 [Parasteatoda tepidariorum]
MPPKQSAIGRSTNHAKRRREERASETSEQRQARQERERDHTALARSLETSEQRQARQQRNRIRGTQTRRTIHTDLNLCGFNYNPLYNYSLHPSVIIGKMDKKCTYCGAQKFKNETPGMCCAGGKVKLPNLRTPPEPLLTLVSGETSQSKIFLKNIRKYNSCFPMTSFGATNIVSANYMPTFKVQGQIYHHAGSLLPLPNADHKYLQIYFMGNTDEQINRRCQLNMSTKREVVAELQNLQFNAQTIDEVAIVIVGEEFTSRDIILYRRNGEVHKISETHRSYDALQYPILFWQGEDGYHFNINMRNPTTNVDINKKVSAMHYYAYRMMIRENADNHILKCRQLFHQYIVDMYAKIESERLLYIRLNQVKLRSEEYIHLRDAVVNDGNLSEFGKMVILPSAYTGSPRHMHEYAQDAMTYVRAYGLPDFFITFTYNPAWDEIKQLLLTGQSP